MAKQGMRNTSDFSTAQRPTAFGKGIKLQGRVTREDAFEQTRKDKPGAPENAAEEKTDVASRTKKVKFPFRPSGAKRK